MRKKFNKIIQKDLFDILKYSPNLNFLRNKSFMITGGSGMLLTYLILFFSYLNFYHKKNIKVYLLSTNILRDKKKLTIYGKLKNIFFLKINRSYLLKNNLKIDYVIHGAGYGDPKLFEKKKNQAINNGITSTIKLLAYSKKKKIKKFIYISSGAVYGKNGENKTVNENFNKNKYIDLSSNLYGYVKYISENYCRQYIKQKNFLINIIRPTHCYGPTYNRISKDSRFMSELINSILKKKRFLVKGNLNNKRSFTHVIDFTTALLFIIKFSANGEIYNIGNDLSFTNIKNVLTICKKLYSSFSYKILLKKKIEISKMFMISKKLNKLGWKAKINLKNGISRTLDFYSQK